MKKNILFFIMICYSVIAAGQSIQSVEYYIDTDPGFGNGIALTPPFTDTYAFNADVTALTNGLHTLYIRTKDANGNWGFSEQHQFVKIENTVFLTNQLLELEYYFNQDPGFGNGVSIPLTPNDTVFAFNPDVSNLSAGLHNLYVRAKDNEGNWGFSEKHSFVKIETPDFVANQLLELEYYLDQDPGFGNGVSIPLTPNDTVVVFSPDLSNVSVGLHHLYIRAKDSKGNWGFSEKHSFVKLDAALPPTIAYLEYYVDTDPGEGNGISLAIPLGQTVIEGPFILDMKNLSIGIHTLYVRAKDTNNEWSFVAQHVFNKTGVVMADSCGIVWQNTVNTTASPNTLQKSTNDNSWSAGGNSYDTLFLMTDGLISMEALETNTTRAFGLASANMNADISSIDYAICLKNNAVIEIQESGVSKGTFGNYQTGDIFQVILTDSIISYWKNDSVFYTSMTLPMTDLMADFSIFTQGGTIYKTAKSFNCGASPPCAVGTPMIDSVSYHSPNDCFSSNGDITISATSTSFMEYSIDSGQTWQSTNTFTGLTIGNYNVLVKNIMDTCAASGGLIQLMPSTVSPTFDTLYATTCDTALVGVTTQTLVNQYGCDSTITTITSLLPFDIDTLYATTCDTALVGVTTQTLVNQHGCDSTITTITSLLPFDIDTLYATTCDTALVGVTTQTLVNQYGCDSTITTITSLLPFDIDTLYATTCDTALVGITTQTLVNQYGCDSTITTITSLLPSLNLGITPDTMICIGETVELEATGGTTYSWSPITGLSNPLIGNPIATPTISTTYTVSVSMVNHCPTMDSVRITVVPNPMIEALGDTSICIGESTSLDATGGVFYYWMDSISLNAGNIPNPIATPTTTSTYVVVGIDNNGCQAMDSVSVEVFQTQTPIITAIADTLTASNVTPPATFQWFLNGVLIDGATDATHVAAVSGLFTVEVIDLNGCVSTSMAYQHIHTGLKNIESIDFMIRPNPAQDYVIIQFTMPHTGALDVKVRDIVGRVVYEEEYSRYHGIYKNRLNTSRFIEGLYVVELMVNGRLYTKKLIVTN